MLKIKRKSFKNYIISRDQLPSPESLKRKILVKAKKLPSGKTSEDDIEYSDDENEDLDEKRKTKPKVLIISKEFIWWWISKNCKKVHFK